jgi:hypothetical protein
MHIVDIILEYDTEASIIDWINSNYDTFTQTVNVCDKHRFSPLQYACRYNYTDVVNLLKKRMLTLIPLILVLDQYIMR